MKKHMTARISSLIFHPLLVPSLSCLLILQSGHYLQYVENQLLKAILIVVSTISFFIPLLLIPLFYFQGSLPDLSFKKKKHRILLLTLLFITYSAGIFLMRHYGFPRIITNMFTAYTVGILILTLLQLMLKLSMHTAAWGAITGLCLFININYGQDLRLFFIILIIISGIVGTSRLKVKERKPAEIYWSFLLGCISMLGGMFLLH